MTYNFEIYNNDTGEILLSGTQDASGMNREQARNMVRAKGLEAGIRFLEVDIRIRLTSTDPLMRSLSIEWIMEKHGVTQTQLSKRFGIPYKTIQNWKALGKERRQCPEYVLRMMDELLSKK